MPIRMTDDPNQPNDNNFNDDTGGGRKPNFPGGGGGGIMQFLPMLLGLFKGKGIIVLIALAAGAYFFMSKGGGCNIADVVKNFSQSGYSFSPDEFNKASVYEGLADDATKNPLPESVSLLNFAPSRLNQGQQGSCVAWSSAYAAQTILTSAATHADPNTIRFSPSYLYNQIRLDGCQGSYIQRAMEAMSKTGGVPLSQYPYNDQDCQSEPDGNDLSKGRQNVIHGFTRLTTGDNTTVSVRSVKEHLSKDAPVVIGMMVGGSFMQEMAGQEVWHPQGMDNSQQGFGGHAMCVIGYDDRKEGGAFQIMNSWGPEWGKDGIGWVRYADFSTFVREAYGIDPLPKRSDVASIPLECSIGLVNNENNQNISLSVAGNNLFQTVTPIVKGTRFKVSIENKTECYIYIFAMQTDGSSLVLFPYMKPGETVSKHSPYCGITGYRLFPKAQSLEADTIGNRDYVAFVVSKEALDYNSINQRISSSTKTDFAGKVNDALNNILIRSAKFNNTNDGRIYFKVDANDNKAVACVVAFDKK